MTERPAPAAPAIPTRDLRLVAERSVLVLVDYQERLMPVIADPEGVLERAVFLGNVAREAGVTVIGTEQNPVKLGPNVREIVVTCDATLGKQHFGACEEGLVEEITRRQVHPGFAPDVVVAGCEAHVCLLQTALGLLERGLAVWVVADACGSRHERDRDLAMARLSAAGATIVSAEMVAFEWMHTSEHPRFRAVSALVKQRP